VSARTWRKLATPLQGKKHIESKLVGYDENNVVLNDGKGEKDYKLPLTKIEKINEAIKFD